MALHHLPSRGLASLRTRPAKWTEQGPRRRARRDGALGDWIALGPPGPRGLLDGEPPELVSVRTGQQRRRDGRDRHALVAPAAGEMVNGHEPSPAVDHRGARRTFRGVRLVPDAPALR